MYRLSPSDFAFLYQECKHCYYLKIKEGIYRPSSPFPAVFGALNTRIQGYLIGKNLKELSPDLPDGIVESQEGWVQSTVVPGMHVFIKGKYDLLVRQSDGTYIVVDFKISQPSEEKVTKYQTQLQAYHYAFSHPVEGKIKNVTKLGLIILYPDKVRFENGHAHFNFPPTWMEVAINHDKFLEFLRGIEALLTGPLPPENPACQWCKYRHLGERRSHPQQLSLTD